MTRKHYQKVATALYNYRRQVEQDATYGDELAMKLATMEDIAQLLSDIFQGDNELFDEERFLGACVEGK
jgi:hypothetical protein